METLYLDTQRQNLLAQAQLTASALQGQALETYPTTPYSQAANVQPGVHTRLLADQGALVVGLPSLLEAQNPEESSLQLSQVEDGAVISPEEMLARSEVSQALAGQPATAIRRVAVSGGHRLLYAAAPVQDDSGAISGLVYLVMPLPSAGLPTGALLSLGAIGLAALACIDRRQFTGAPNCPPGGSHRP